MKENNNETAGADEKNEIAESQDALSRRDFVKSSMFGGAALGGLLYGLYPLKDLKVETTLEAALQQHYYELTKEDKKKIFARIEAEALSKYDKKVSISDPSPLNKVEFGYALNLRKCIGCRTCVYACVKENNLSRRSPQIQYIRVLERLIEGGDHAMEQSEHYYEQKEVPEAGKFYMPCACQQCRRPACTKVCPVKATWQEPDGVTVVDYNWCIGCRYCEAACPYWARRFNFSEPDIKKNEINPDQGYLTNRLRMKGVMEKCHFCLHRTRKGKNPACHDACPTGSRKFGNLLDKESEIRYIIREKRVFILKEDVGNSPRFYYFFD